MRLQHNPLVFVPEVTTKTRSATCGVCLCSVLTDGSSYYDPVEPKDEDASVSLVLHPHKPGESLVRALQAEAKSFAYEKVKQRFFHKPKP